jgi:ABC-type polysaccharide/polyol phosphate transport system ATPase subunit
LKRTHTSELFEENTVKDYVKVTWKDLKYEVDIRKASHRPWKRKKGEAKYERKEILKGISGEAYPGETLFIMGASGCGKTSLLNIISDRI